ncbi:hypothetical protein EBQ74_02185 [bacterium]|nr:hypothetical protein [bacterium]
MSSLVWFRKRFWGEFMKTTKWQLGLIFSLIFGGVSFAAPETVRWTGKDDKNATLVHVLEVIRNKTGVELSQADFMLVELEN